MLVRVNTQRMWEEWTGPILFMGAVVLMVVVICVVSPVAVYYLLQWSGYWLGGE